MKWIRLEKEMGNYMMLHYTQSVQFQMLPPGFIIYLQPYNRFNFIVKKTVATVKIKNIKRSKRTKAFENHQCCAATRGGLLFHCTPGVFKFMVRYSRSNSKGIDNYSHADCLNPIDLI